MVVCFQVSWAASFPEYLRCPFCGCLCINSSPSGDPFFPILGPAQDDISQSPAQTLGVNGEWWRLDLHGPQAALRRWLPLCGVIPSPSLRSGCHGNPLSCLFSSWAAIIILLQPHGKSGEPTRGGWATGMWLGHFRATADSWRLRVGWPQGSPGGTCPHQPIIVSHKVLLSHAALTAPRASSPWRLPSPSLGPTPQPWLLCTVGSWSCGEPGRVPEVTWFSQLTGFLDCMFCRSTFLSL